MNKIVGMSLIVSTFLMAETIDLGAITVVGETLSKEVKDIRGDDLKSADLADALSRNSASITMIRGSGVANDIILRGQKKDNINILMDDAKIYGGCPNRMDPTITHINADNIENVKIVEGPYDVEHFGTLSGLVVAETKTPTQEPSGDVNLGMGSYGYKKAAASASGGNEYIRALISASTEQSDQYKDGNGKTLSEQLNNAIAQHMGTATNRYRDGDLKAYEKKTFMGKVFITPVENQEIRLGYTLNRSDNVLYPSRMMDADYDDSDIYTFGYSIYDLGTYSKEINLEAYESKVEHPMSGKWRVIPTTGMMAGTYMTAKMNTDIEGAKLKNVMNLGGGEFMYGVDVSRRNWDGVKYSTNFATGVQGASTVFMPDVDTTNEALFAQYITTIDAVKLQFGTRYDDTEVKANKKVVGSNARDTNDYDALSANVLATYKVNNNVDYFLGFGKASRVPDAKELYLGTNPLGNLDQTTNYEADAGFKTHYDNFGVNGKIFYSILKDYIYYNSSKYVNIDAVIYGAELDAYYNVSEAWTLNYGMTYLRGQKDDPIAGQNDKDLADIVPLKAIVGVTYHQAEHTLKTEMVAAKRWNNVDSDNGEQELPGYTVFNMKYNYQMTKHFDVTLGVDNIFDKTYAVSNTYSDITLLSGGGDVMLMNEPGRYAYINLHYKF
jgi:iron complex outermembrane receptor protein